MKKFGIGLAAAFLLGFGADASTATETANPRPLLKEQLNTCEHIVVQSMILHREKDIMTLMKTRREMRQTLIYMNDQLDTLRQSEELRSEEDYLLSIREGVRRMQRLAEEPMNRSNMEEIRDMCNFIATVDRQILESLGSEIGKEYRAAR